MTQFILMNLIKLRLNDIHQFVRCISFKKMNIRLCVIALIGLFNPIGLFGQTVGLQPNPVVTEFSVP